VSERSIPPPGGSTAGRKGKRSRGSRDFGVLAQRRMRAVDMFEAGKRQVDVVVGLGVSAQTASRWHKAWVTGGRGALSGVGRAGRPPKLDDEQIAQVEAVLIAGPRANGFATELWTLARVAEVIERVTGVSYSPAQTWTILRERMGWSRQRPARKARERDEQAIAAWRKTEWPRIKKALGAEARGSVSKMKADSPCCPQ
jgi:transposase